MLEAEATAQGEDVIVRVLEHRAIGPTELPETLVRYAVRTHETVILADASAKNQFSADDYIMRSRARSILNTTCGTRRARSSNDG